MPIEGATYRVRHTPKGNVRLAFDADGEVVEAKSLDSGKVHTRAEFKADKKQRAKKAKKRSLPWSSHK